MNYILFSALFLTILAGCKNSTEPMNLPRTAYQRAVGPFLNSFAGADSSMDACLSISRQSTIDTPDSTLWSATAAFNVGDYVSLIGLVSLAGQALPWNNANESYRLDLPKFDSTMWSVQDYNSMNFSEKVTMPPRMRSLNHPEWDTVSKTLGFTIKYSGLTGGTLTVTGIHSLQLAPYKDSLGFVDYFFTSDTGSVTIAPEMLKDIPVGSKVDIELWHDKFYTKVISANSVSHKVGFYTQTESDLFFMLGK